MIPGSYKSDKAINITGIGKIHLKCDCIQGSIVNGTCEPFLYSFALNQPPGHKIYKELRIKLLKKVNKSVLSHIIFYLKDNDHKAVDFNGEVISFTCQLIKIEYSYLYTYHYMSIYTTDVHTIIFVFISETSRITFVLIQIYEYLYKGIRTII